MIDRTIDLSHPIDLADKIVKESITLPISKSHHLKQALSLLKQVIECIGVLVTVAAALFPLF